MKSEYYPDIEKKDLFKQGYIGNSFHWTFFTFQAFEGTDRLAMGVYFSVLKISDGRMLHNSTAENCNKQQDHLILVVQQLIRQ